jgi:tetratricopeptide (TPR) repeat protein
VTPTREGTSKDEILGLPDDALDFREWWQELTGRKVGRPLIVRLRDAVASGALGALTESTETAWTEVAKIYGGRREANILECAILCARLATIDPGDGLAVHALCDRFSSLGRPLKRDGIDRSRWPVWLADVIDQSPEGSLFRPEDSSFSPAIAWDLVNRFWAERQDSAAWARSPLPSCRTLVALLVDRRVEKMSDGKSAYSERGATAEVMLELLPHGRGQIFPDPEKLLFVKQDGAFREAVVSAQASVRELLGSDIQDHDVRWTLTSHGDQHFTELAKGSAGGAFALGLAVLWSRSTDRDLRKKVKGLDVSRVAVTAKLKEEDGVWRFTHVDAFPAKMWAAAQRPEEINVVYVAPGQPCDDVPNLRVVEASTLRELVEKLHKEPRERPAPRWSSQAVRRLISLLLVIFIAGGVWLYRLGQLRQAEREVDHWRDKTLVSVLPSRYSTSEIAKVYVDDSEPLDLVQELIHRRDFSQAARALDTAAQQGRADRPRFHTLAGDIYYFQNQYDKAAPYYEQAAVRAGPDDVETQSDLALALLQSQKPDAPARIERALRIQRHVIAVMESATWPWPSTADRQKWACAHLNLARLLVDRPRYRARSIEAALKSLEKALTVFTSQADSRAWAYITSMQGVAWQNKPDGNRTDNVKHSLKYLEDALAVYKRLQMRRKVFFNSYMLGVAWGQLREGDRTVNFEKALGFFRDADDALGGDLANQYPADKAKILRARGLVLIYRRTGDRAANLEQAIDCYRRALNTFEHLGQSIDAAKTKTDLARAILRRSGGIDGNDVETAVGYLLQAADFLAKDKFEVEWAQVQDDLGTAYRQRLAGDHFANLTKSVAHYEGALSVRVRMGRAGRFADTLNGLGRTMLAMADRDGNAATERAVSLFQDALSLLPKSVPHSYIGHTTSMPLQQRTDSELSPAEAPEYLAETSVNMGDALCILTTSDRKSNYKIAEHYYRMAERYYVRIPYYSPELSAVRRKLQLLSEKKSLPRPRSSAQRD